MAFDFGLEQSCISNCLIWPPRAVRRGWKSFEVTSSLATVGVTYVLRAPVSNSVQNWRPLTATSCLDSTHADRLSAVANRLVRMLCVAVSRLNYTAPAEGPTTPQLSRVRPCFLAVISVVCATACGESPARTACRKPLAVPPSASSAGFLGSSPASSGTREVARKSGRTRSVAGRSGVRHFFRGARAACGDGRRSAWPGPSAPASGPRDPPADRPGATARGSAANCPCRRAGPWRGSTGRRNRNARPRRGTGSRRLGG